MTKINLSKEELSLFKSANRICMEDGNSYYYFPYYIKENSIGETFLVSPDKLPDNVKKMINENRNPETA